MLGGAGDASDRGAALPALAGTARRWWCGCRMATLPCPPSFPTFGMALELRVESSKGWCLANLRRAVRHCGFLVAQCDRAACGV